MHKSYVPPLYRYISRTNQVVIFVTYLQVLGQEGEVTLGILIVPRIKSILVPDEHGKSSGLLH
jgi:hypothetical protein